MKKTTIFIFLIYFQISNYAQDTIQLQTFTVNATRIATPSYKTGRSIEVISNKELTELPVNSVDELLRFVSGVNLNSRNGFGVQADIGMRGSTFSQVLIMLDNVRLNNPLTAHFNNNIPVALAEIHHIEIIKGPAGASYGADAVGGLIHIKTKAYVASQRENKLDLSGDLAIGEHNLSSSDIGINYQKEKLLIAASNKTSIADGEELLNPNFTAGISSDSTYHNYFDIKTHSLALAYLFNDNWKIYARGGKDHRDFSARYFYTQSNYDESTEETTNAWGQTALTFQKNKHHIEVNYGYQESSDYFAFNPLFAANEHTMKQQLFNFDHNYKANESTSFSYGAQWINKNIESTDRGNHENSTIGFYGVVSQSIGNNFFINASGRVENDQNFGTEFLPQLSLSYKKKNLILRSSYGRSIRAADFTERFVSYKIPDLSPGRNAGNPDLKAEKSNSIDLGFDLFLPKSLKVSSSIFYRASSNLIDFSLRNSSEITNLNNLQANADYFYADNISESTTQGIEISTEKKLVFTEKNDLKLQLNYTFLETAVETGELSKYIANHPKHNFSIIANLNLGNFSCFITSNSISRRGDQTPGISGNIRKNYTVINAKLAYGFSNWFSVYGKVFNLGNIEYQEILGANMPRRWLAFGVNFKVNK